MHYPSFIPNQKNMWGYGVIEMNTTEIPIIFQKIKGRRIQQAV
jgi:hypothetical protein